MSGQRAPSSSPMLPQPQPFRFWLPYRTFVWRQQPRPPSSRPVPSSSRPQPPPPPPPPPPTLTTEPSRSRARAAMEDIPIQADSSDESDTIPIQSSDSSQLRGAGQPSMADLELTLSGAPPPTGQEQSSGGRDGNDTKIAISGFPRSRLFDGGRAPFRKDIEDGLKSLASRGATASRPPENGQGYRVVTLAGHNVGASMVVGSRDAHAPPPSADDKPEGRAGKPAAAVAANVNSNVQSVNNSSMEGSACSAGNPGVHVDVKSGREEPQPATVAPTPPPPPPREDKKPKELKKRPPLVVPPRPRRCLRALMMENNGSDTEAAARKPRPGACRFQCVEDHAPPKATASNGGGAGGENAEDGGKASAAEAN